MTNDLLERVKAATGPDRELDWRIAEVLNIPEPWPATTAWPPFMAGSKFDKALPAYTTSVDAALALVERCLPGWKRSLFEKRGGGWIARVSSPRWDTFTSGEDTPMPTAPLAILAALLSALTAPPETPHDE